MPNYSHSDVVRLSFPPWVTDSHGRVSRTWHVVLCEPAARDPGALEVDEPLLEVAASGHPDDTRVMEVLTVATGDPMSDETFYWATYRVFLAIDEQLGRIASIEGCPRSAWQPFRG